MKIFFLIAPVFGLILLSACASKEFKDEFDTERPWSEQVAELPPYPDPGNLVSFDAGPNTDYQHFIDTDSIDVGQDGVIRFTLINQSPTGAMNISYEGIRCATNERKLYAIGRDNKTWAKPRISEWEPLEYVRQFYAQRELSKNIFCPHKQIVNNRDEAIRVLKKGKHPAVFR